MNYLIKYYHIEFYCQYFLGNFLGNYLYGGEDFVSVYTVSKKKLNKVKGFLVGKITREKGVRICKEDKEELLTKHGYDHFLTEPT